MMKGLTPIKYVIFSLMTLIPLFAFSQVEKSSLNVYVEGPQGVELNDIKVSLNVGDFIYLPDTIIGNKAIFRTIYKSLYTLTASAKDFETVFDTVQISRAGLMEKHVELRNREFTLPVVQVKGKIRAVVFKGDTIQFNPAAVNKLRGDMAREILEQMPGVEIDGVSIKVFGNTITDTYVNGSKLFGDNPTTALDHVEANEVMHIQTYEDKQKRNDNGRYSWAMNIVTKTKMINSADGKVIAAIGRDMVDEGVESNTRKALGGVFNFFSEELTFSGNLMGNNENVSSTNDLRFLQIQRVNPTFSDNACAGLSVSRNWKERTKGLTNIGLGYQYTEKSTKKSSHQSRDYTPYGDIDFRNYNEDVVNSSETKQHTVNVSTVFRLTETSTLSASVDQAFGRGNELFIRKYQDVSNFSNSKGSSTHNKDNKEERTTAVISYGKSINQWVLSVRANMKYGQRDDEAKRNDSVTYYGSDVRALHAIELPGETRNKSFNVTAMMHKYFQNNGTINRTISFEQSLAGFNENLAQSSWDIITNTLDSVNTYSYRDKRIVSDSKVKYSTNVGKSGLAFIPGLRYEHIYDDNRLVGTNESYDFVSPTLELSWSLMTKNPANSISLGYNLIPGTPNIAQLRSNIDNSNLNFIVTGNPNLKANITHRLSTSIRKRLGLYGGNIATMIYADFIKNNIVNKTTFYPEATFIKELNIKTLASSSVSTFDNLDGGMKLSTYIVGGFPISGIRSHLTLSLSHDFSRLPFFYNQILDKSYTNHIFGGGGIDINAIKKTRLTFRNFIGYDNFWNKNSERSGKVLTYALDFSSHSDLGRKFFLKTDYKYNVKHNSTLKERYVENILNLYFGLHFLRNDRAELSITAYDVLNSFNNHSISLMDNYTLQRRDDNYGRFVSLNFTWTFRKYNSMPSNLRHGLDW